MLVRKKIYLIILGILAFSSSLFAATTSYQYDDLNRLTRVERSNGTVTLYEYDKLGNRTSKVVTSNTTVVAHFTATPTSGEVPLDVVFTDQSVGNIISWLWDFGDGSTSTQRNPSHTYTAQGNHTISLTVNTAGDYDTKSVPNFIITNGVASGPVLSVEPQYHSISSASRVITFDVSNSGLPGSNMNWTATENESWLNISSGSSGLNSGTVSVVVSSNTGSVRTGTITIISPDVLNSPVSVQITQAAPLGPSVSIQSPTGDEVFMLGETHDIQWTASSPHGIDRINIYYHYNGDEYQIVSLNENTGSYSWTIPFPSQYICPDATIRIVAYDNNGDLTDAFSQPFRVQDSAAPPEPWNIPEKVTTKIDLGLYISEDNNSGAIAVDSLGNVHMVYRYVEDDFTPSQPRKYKQKIYYQKKTSGSWMAPEEIYNLDVTSSDNNPPGYSFSEFNIAVDSNNHPHISWVYCGPIIDFHDQTGINEDEIYYLGFNGTSWEPAVNVSDNMTYSRFSDIAIDTNDNVHFTWHDGVTYTATGDLSGTAAIYHRIKLANNSWSETIPVINTDRYGNFPAIAKGQNGKMHMIYNTLENIEYVLWDGSSWSSPPTILENGNYYNFKDIIIDSSNQVHVAYIAYGDFENGTGSQIRYIFFNGLTWSEPDIVSVATNGNGKIPLISLNSQGWPQLVWYEISPSVAHIYYKQKTPLGWSNTIQLNTVATIPPNMGYNNLSIGISSDDILHVIWPSYFDGGDEIYYTFANIGSFFDSDGDGISDEVELDGCTDPYDMDTDDDGIADGDEDVNLNGLVELDETDPCDIDTDGDGLQDGTEKGIVNPIADPDGAGPLLGTDLFIFQPDLDPFTTTDPLAEDSDFDGLNDGQEDFNFNGMLDIGETQSALNANKPAIDFDGLGISYLHTDSYDEAYAEIRVIDHDGIASDGSSHDVSVSIGEQTYPLEFHRMESSTVVYYKLWIGGIPASGDYIFKVVDPQGNIGTRVDSLTVQEIPSPTSLSCTVNETMPVFNWDLSSGATNYRVNIHTQDGNFLTSIETKQPPFIIPPGILLANTTYKYYIDARDDHNWRFDLDNHSNAPAYSFDLIEFTTGDETQSPFTYNHGDGVHTFKDGTSTPGLSVYFNIFDAQGVPDNIQSVRIELPNGNEFSLEFDYNKSPTEGSYKTWLNNPIDTGDYIIHIEDKDGNQFSFTDYVNSQPLEAPGNINLTTNKTEASFSWAPVSRAVYYEVRIFDMNTQQIYDCKTTSTSHLVPEGILKTNNNYKYRITAHDQFPEDDMDNSSASARYDSLPVFSTCLDSDNDDLSNEIELRGCTNSLDSDTDDDGISDGEEDKNKNGIVDPDETDPCDIDTDGDGIQDGTEKGITIPVDDPDGTGPILGTDTTIFQPDLDTDTRTNPLNTDSDGDGFEDGVEDTNFNGRVDPGETDAAPVQNMPVIDGDTWGAVSFMRGDNDATYFWAKIIDHDGVADDGLSHVVTASIGSIDYSLNFQFKKNSYTAFYDFYINEPAVTGDYILSVTDPEDNTATLTDNVLVDHLPLPTNLSYTSDGTTPEINWTPSSGASYYRVRIFNLDSSTVWRGYPPNPPYTVPPGVLNENTTYKYRIEAWDGHAWGMDKDNISITPAIWSDYPTFTTISQTETPHIDRRDEGIKVFSSDNFGVYLCAWIRVYDAQGIPGNIKSVKVIMPNSVEIPLYLDYNQTPTRGVYGTEYFGDLVSGDYTIVVEDVDGNSDSRTEYIDVDPLAPVTGFNIIVTDTQVDFSWDTVTGAAFYRVELWDLSGNLFKGFSTTETTYSIPEGYLARNTSYKYRVTAWSEFPEEIPDNYSANVEWYDMPTFTVDPSPGMFDPELDLNQNGVYIIHRHAPNSVVSNYWLYFNLKVKDHDGVPENIAKIEVTYPDGITKTELVFNTRISSDEAYYFAYEIKENIGGIQSGTYTFTAIDADGNTSDVVQDDLIIDPVDIAENLSPSYGSILSTTSPEIFWDEVPEASFYRVRIYSGYNTRIYSSPRLPVNSFTVPKDILQKGGDYSYRVDAYREETGSLSNMSSSKAFISERLRFTIADANGSIIGRLVDLDSNTLSGIEITLDQVIGDSNQYIAGTTTLADGSFSFSDLNSDGEYRLTINHEMESGFPSQFVKNLIVTADTILDVGDIQLQDGVEVIGIIKDADSVIVSNIFLHYMGHHLDGFVQTDINGKFSIILPKGIFEISPPADNSTPYLVSEPNIITIADTLTPIDMGDITVYDSTQVIQIKGTATAPFRYDGELFVVAFSGNYDFSIQTDDLVDPLSFASMNPDDNSYSLLVPPESDYSLLNGFLSQSSSGIESISIVDSIPVSIGITPVSGIDFTIDTQGFFVLGGVSGNGDIDAKIGLYNISDPTPVFTGITGSDNKGKFEFFNVPSGDYKIGAFVPDTGAEFFSEEFTVSDTAVTVNEIGLVNDGFGSDTDKDKDVDGGNLTIFSNSFAPGVPVVDHPMDLNSDGFVDGLDLKIFAENFGRTSF